MIRVKIATGKIDKTALFVGEKATYLDVVLIETPDSQYGDDYMVVQDLPKDRRDAGEKGPILGNAKIVVKKDQSVPKPAVSTGSAPADDLPF